MTPQTTGPGVNAPISPRRQPTTALLNAEADLRPSLLDDLLVERFGTLAEVRSERHR